MNSSASGTAITATPATPAPTTSRRAAMYHHPPSGASASAPVASENMRMPAISGRRRPRRSPARPQTMLPRDRPDARGQQHHRRLPERQVPFVGQVGDDEGDQEEVEQVQHRAHHHGPGQQVEAPCQRRLVERLQHRGGRAAQGVAPPRARPARACGRSSDASTPAPAVITSAPASSTQNPAAGSASPTSRSVVTSGCSHVGQVDRERDHERDHTQHRGRQRGQALAGHAREHGRGGDRPRPSPRAPRSAGPSRCAPTPPRWTRCRSA